MMHDIDNLRCPRCGKHIAHHDASSGDVSCPECNQTWEPCPVCGHRLFTEGKCGACGYATPTPFDELLPLLQVVMMAEVKFHAHIEATKEPEPPGIIESQAQWDAYHAHRTAWENAREETDREYYRLQKVYFDTIGTLATHANTHFPGTKYFRLPDPVIGGYWEVTITYRQRASCAAEWRWYYPPQPQPDEYVPTDFDVVQGAMDGDPTYDQIIAHALHLAANYLRIWQAAHDQSDIGLAHLAAAIKRETQDG